MSRLLASPGVLAGLLGATLLAGCTMDHVTTNPLVGPGSLESGPVTDPVLATWFDRQVEVFGLLAVASAETPPDKHRHAAHVLAQYIDNDADGAADDVWVLRNMQRRRATLVMFADGADREGSSFLVASLPRRYGVVELLGDETDPSPDVFDAALRQAWYPVHVFGWGRAHGEAFAPVRTSAAAHAMDRARGGRFLGTPSAYPPEAWFHSTSQPDYRHHVRLYVFYIVSTWLGAQAGHCAEIAHEWEPCTPEQLRERDPRAWSLLHNPRFDLPQVLPDGRYEGPRE